MNVGHKNEQNFYPQRKIKSVKKFQSANSYHIDIEWKKNIKFLAKIKQSLIDS